MSSQGFAVEYSKENVSLPSIASNSASRALHNLPSAGGGAAVSKSLAGSMSRSISSSHTDAPEEYKDMVFDCEIMDDPVIAADGFTYNRPLIELWLKDHNTSPKSSAILQSKALIPNRDLKSRIIAWKEQQERVVSLTRAANGGTAVKDSASWSSPQTTPHHDQGTASPPTIQKFRHQDFGSDIRHELYSDNVSIFENESTGYVQKIDVPAKLVYLKSSKTYDGAYFACLRFILNDRANDIMLLPGTQCQLLFNPGGDVEFVQVTLPRSAERYFQSLSLSYQDCQVTARSSSEASSSMFGSIRRAVNPNKEVSRSLFGSIGRGSEYSRLNEHSHSTTDPVRLTPRTEAHMFTFTFKSTNNMNWYCFLTMCLQRTGVKLIEDSDENAFICPHLDAAQTRVEIKSFHYLHLLARHERVGDAHGTATVLASRIKQFLELFPQILMISKDLMRLDFKVTVLPNDSIIFEGMLLLPWLVHLMVVQQKQAAQSCIIRFLRRHLVWRSKFSSLFASMTAWMPPQKLIRGAFHLNVSHLNASIHHTVFFGSEVLRHKFIKDDRQYEQCRPLRERLPALRVHANKHIRDVNLTLNHISLHSAVCRALPKFAEALFVSSNARQFIAMGHDSLPSCKWDHRILAISNEHLFFFSSHENTGSDSEKAFLAPLDVQQITPISSLQFISVSPFADDAIILHVSREPLMSEPCYREMEVDDQASTCRGCGEKFPDYKIARALSFSSGLRKTHCRGCGYVFCEGCTHVKRCFPPSFLKPERCCILCNSLLPVIPTQDIVLRDSCNIQILALILSLRPDIRILCDSFCELNNGRAPLRINFLPYDAHRQVSDSADVSSLPIKIFIMASEEGCNPQVIAQKLQHKQLKKWYASLRAEFEKCLPHMIKTLMTLAETGSRHLVLPNIQKSVAMAMKNMIFRKRVQYISWLQRQTVDELNEDFSRYLSSVVDDLLRTEQHATLEQPKDADNDCGLDFNPPDLRGILALINGLSQEDCEFEASLNADHMITELTEAQIAKFISEEKKSNCSTPDGIMQCIALMKLLLDSGQHFCDSGCSPVLFLGSTGVGKSTTVNMLLKKLMVALKVGVSKCIAVADGQDEASAIGHSKTQSATVKPISVLTDDRRLLLADFPGFEDTRGFAFNIANMANIKRFFGLFKTGARIVLLFEWSSLEPCRGKLVKDTISLLKRMFTPQNISKVFDSILIAITKVKGYVEQEEYDQNVQINIINSLKEAGWNLKCSDIKLVDPLMEHQERISQSCQSEELWQSILALRPLENGFSIFTPSLLDSDADFNAVHQHIETNMILKNMASRRFLHVVQAVKLLRSIAVLGQPTTQECMLRSLQSIIESVKSMCKQQEMSVSLDVTKKLSFRQNFRSLERGCKILEECFDESFPSDQRPSVLFTQTNNYICSQESEMQKSILLRDISKPAEIRIADLKFALKNLMCTDRPEALHNNPAQLETLQAICLLSDTHFLPSDALKKCYKHLCACVDLKSAAAHVHKLCNLFDAVAIEISNRELVFCNPETASLMTFLQDRPVTCLKLVQEHVKNHLNMLQEHHFKSGMSSLSESAPLIISSQSLALAALIDLFLGHTPRPYSISILKAKQYGFDIRSVIQVEAAVAYFQGSVDACIDCFVVIESFFAKLESDARSEAYRNLKKSLLKDIQDLHSPIHLDPKLRLAIQNIDQLRCLDPGNFAMEASRLLLRQKLIDEPLKELQSAIRNPQPNYRDVVFTSLQVMDLLNKLCVPHSSRADGMPNQFNVPQVCLLMDEMRPLLDLRYKISDFERERVKAKTTQWNAELAAAFRLFESESKAADTNHDVLTLEKFNVTASDVHIALQSASGVFNLDSAQAFSICIQKIQKDRADVIFCTTTEASNFTEITRHDESLQQMIRDIFNVLNDLLLRLQLKCFQSHKEALLKPLKDAIFAVIKAHPTQCFDTPEKCRDRISMDVQCEHANRTLEDMKIGLTDEPFRELARSIYCNFMRSVAIEANRCAIDHVISSGELSSHSAELPKWIRALELNGYSDVVRVRDSLLLSATKFQDPNTIRSFIQAKQFSQLSNLAVNAQRLSNDLSSINMTVSTAVLQSVVTDVNDELCTEAVREINECFESESQSESGNLYKECELKNLQNSMDCCHNSKSVINTDAFSGKIRQHAVAQILSATERAQTDPRRIGPIIVKSFLVSSISGIKHEEIIGRCNGLILNAREDHRQIAIDYLSRCKLSPIVCAYASQAFEKLPVLREKELEKLNSKAGAMKDVVVVAKMDPKPKAGDETLLQLSQTMQKEWNQHIQKFVSGKSFDLNEIKARVQTLSEEVKRTLNQGKSFFFCKENVALLLSAIFAAWTILYFRQNGGNEANIQPNSLIRPHDTQKIAILRLIGVDVQQLPKNHLVQVRTGEGKSICLGVTSAFYAIMGQIVHVPCYSPYLSRRDQLEFAPLFKLFDVEEKILYCTFTELAHNLMASGSIVDYRSVASGILTNSTVRPVTSDVKHMIIFDEVDVFWGKDFYGQCYRAVHILDCKPAQDLVKYVWKHRLSLAKHQRSIDQILSETFSRKLLDMYPGLGRFLPFEIGKMIEDVDFFNDQNPVAVKPNSIGYVDQSKGAVCTETTFGYRTAFAYLSFCENGELEYNEFNKKVGLRVFCGSHLYSELPKIATRILGLSATITSFNSSYDRILAPYNLTGPENRTIMPSTFDKKELDQLDPIISDSVDDFFEELKKEVKARLVRERPTLIFFDSKELLFDFCKHLEARSIITENYRRFEILTNETPLADRDDIIFRSGDKSAITLLTRSYGRGTDFKCLHPDVDAAGGVHVILTFVPESQSELTQIQGRTCRQDYRGSFRLMLCKEHINGDCSFAKGENVADILRRLRDQSEQQRVDDMFSQLEIHEPQCSKSQQMAKIAETNVVQAEKMLFDLQGYGSQPFSTAQSIEVAFLFDATKSMGPYIDAAKERVMNIANDVKRGVAAANPKISGKDLDSFVKFAFVGYRDWNASGTFYDAPGNVESFDLSSDIKGLKSFIQEVRPHGGGDLAEDVAGGLRAVESLQWSPASAKCVFMLADAPCHGSQYHSLQDSSDSSSLFNSAAGKTRFDKSVARDQYHNVVGSQYDLSPDGAFNGHIIAVYLAYTGEGFTFQEPKAALEKKGFTVILWYGQLPPLDEFQETLDKSCQLWLVSGENVTLSEGHIQAVIKFTEARKGLFLWGDNDPLHADANAIISRLPCFGGKVELKGNFYADQVLSEHTDPQNMRAHGPHGFKPHFITTGLESLYEGITISDIRDPQELCEPIITCSDGHSHVTCLYAKDKYRILIDGGFTRLYPDRWARTAGTSRFVTNAACYLAAFEDKADHFPGGDPRGSVPELQIESLITKHKVKFFFVNICREKTDQMVGVWNRHLSSRKVRNVDTSLNLGQAESDGDIMDRFATQISRAILADFTSPASRR